MVTHSKFGGMHRPVDSPGQRLYRLKTFASKNEYNLIVNTVRKLKESGFYWSTMNGAEANRLLSPEPAGTFLIRDSSDNRHFFTLSVKTDSGTKNLRIQCENCAFFLQTDSKSAQAVPKFDCVLKLVHHYMSAKSPATGNVKRGYFIYSGGEKVPLILSKPLASSVSTLQHLCRRTVNVAGDMSGKVDGLPMPVRQFLQEYDSPV
ncbi:suppressor of cytokine signaling 3 [Callorhinchus milii]|uniref:Suppressor of cytokine signaling 3 n=1 Tax=Callorhinchus milii TaxID=7868 RepID=A0A4W3K721_CALMI|nr:suppressor of cytokine signaling 3 [Callorhinchus milii]|eukprot:gi/632943236/ref/XP_007886842.1/ PREDICTED: suppressor of cytokine signaling 3 [Callorhinchus milii]